MAPVPATGFATTTGFGAVGAGGAAGTAAGASVGVAAGVALAELEGTSKVTRWPDCAGATVCQAGRNRLWACMAARGPSHCLPFKRKVRVVSLRLTGRKVVIDDNHVHPVGAVNEGSGGVDGTEAGLGFAHGVRGHDCQKAVHG